MFVFLRIYHSYSTLEYYIYIYIFFFVVSNKIDDRFKWNHICIPLGSPIIHSETVESVTGTDQDPTYP